VIINPEGAGLARVWEYGTMSVKVIQVFIVVKENVTENR
jgi:hypothetical protein